MEAVLRALMGADAVRLAAAVGYQSAGTVEFLLDDSGAYRSPRDEHAPPGRASRHRAGHGPGPRGRTGGDRRGPAAVADQATADGRRNGHAVEVRLYAEDAEAGFPPATGTIRRLHWPQGAGIRVDAGVVEGDEVSDRFDPMLAKIVAHGADRRGGADRLAAALDDTTVLGLVTNLRFLRWLVRHPAVRDGQARIDTLDWIWPPDDWAERTAISMTPGRRRVCCWWRTDRTRIPGPAGG